jgi:predicted homoserine dehydrogenase-like protein
MLSLLFVPGGIELAVILLIAVLLFGLPIALVAGYVVLSRARQGDAVTEEDVEEIKEELTELRAAMEEVRDEKGEE